jgi:AmmeMemoRadiSam system radical SAM enzyme/AmmeMemoRadiSam system protein B/AmmeMemoRadiSam system protein A
MARVVTLPPSDGRRTDGMLAGGWWHDEAEGGRIVCDLCPRACSLKEGDRGFCFVRQNLGGEMVLTTYGRSTGFCIDPIEKKPLNHFYPGTSVLSFGTAGCNLGCKFCQNWDISKSREVERLSEVATPEAIAEAARRHGCRSVAFTYNDPVIWAEYAIETARACRAVGIKAVAVTAGYITTEARGSFFEAMDAANVDLKGFTEEFYHRITYSHLQPVLDTLEWLKRETDVWYEITNLVIPQANDAMDDIARMCGWILRHCGDDVPVHFTAFHPDFRMRDRPPTPHATLLEAHGVARREGLKFVYVGNVDDVAHQSTYCPHCGKLLIQRNWYDLGAYHLRGDRCGHCDGPILGRFDDRPGSWGRRRVPVEISRYAGDLRVIDPPPQGQPMKTTPAPSNPVAAASRHGGPPRLDGDQERLILSAAAEFVAAAILGRPARLADPTLAGAADLPVAGAYVTLKRRGHLRACCGMLGEPRALIDALRHAAFRTATEDHRLPPISPTELPYLDLDVSLLHGLGPLRALGRDRVAAVQVGRHGLRVQRGDAGGLLLPSVPVENGWDAEAFLRQVCRKAGLPTTAWQDDDTRLLTFEGLRVGGPFDPGVPGIGGESAALLSGPQLQRLADHAGKNVLALARGMTPDYYALGMPDGTVAGVAVTLSGPGGEEPRHFAQLSFRPGLPLQATLFRLCERAAQALRAEAASTGPTRVGVTVLYDPALHGTIRDPDLRGLDPRRRALLVVEHDRSACVAAPGLGPEQALEVVRREARVLNPGAAGLIGAAVQSTEREFIFSTAPRPMAVGGTRPPAVAGRFYPADPGELSRLVDGLLAASERRVESWSAVMAPHAGLVYSGRLAAEVFNRVAIPELVLVLGPKHTRHGVGWAVAPHDAWAIPGATIPCDPALARALAEAIPGLQLDAAAHQQEHAIEVELPFLATLAPRSRVVGLAIGGGDWERCREFAEGLAGVIRRLPERPLLVISSDMNHFATDRDTRLLDEIALQAMERLDPAHLLATVAGHDISMCGVLPAVIVMETLRLLGGLRSCRRVGYATSAEVSGDLSRVVGYAGMLLD